MGAEVSVLKGCKLDDPLESPSDSRRQDWVIHPARRDDGSHVSVFVHKGDHNSQDSRLQNAAKQLKILRHPTILKFFASCNNVEGTYLITEQVKPLDLVLETLSSEEICVGMYNVIEALSFLHNRGGVSHNNVCTTSIYVSSQDSGWRLGGMEHLCKFEDATAQFLKDSKQLRHSDAIPPEETEDNLTSNAPSIGHARDAYAFGVLAKQLLLYLEELGDITSSFEKRLTAFVDPDPKKRPQLGSLLQDHLFRNDFLEIIKFLNQLTLKTEQEKNVFFEDLAHRLHRLPVKLTASRLAPMLVSSFVMAEPVAVDKLFVHLLTPKTDSKASVFKPHAVNPVIPQDLFKEHVLPLLCSAFQLRDSHVRLVLLRHFSSYVHMFDNRTLRSKILCQLLVGLKDVNDEIVSATFHALAYIVPILGSDIVVGGDRAKYFIERKPKFHTRENGAVKQKHGNVTAVSGIIALPLIEKMSCSNEVIGETPGKPITELNERCSSMDEEKHQRMERLKKTNHVRIKDREPQQILNKQVENAAPSLTHSEESSCSVKLQETQDNDWLDWENMEDDEDSTQLDPSLMSKNSSYNSQIKDHFKDSLSSRSDGSAASKLVGLSTVNSYTKPSNTPALGQEFALPDITPKPSKVEFDFFAGMEPSFGKPFKVPPHSSVLQRQDKTEELKSKFSFQMDDTSTMRDETCWDEEDDVCWNLEEE